MKKLLVEILASIPLMVAASVPVYATDVFSHTVLLMPHELGNEKSWLKVIKNQQEWEEYFYSTMAAITYVQGKAPVAPELDFKNYQVIAGGLGLRSSGGYTLAIDSVRQFEDVMYIHVLDIRPGPGCVVTAALTYPSITVLVKKTETPIRYSVSELIASCAE